MRCTGMRCDADDADVPFESISNHFDLKVLLRISRVECDERYRNVAGERAKSNKGRRSRLLGEVIVRMRFVAKSVRRVATDEMINDDQYLFPI